MHSVLLDLLTKWQQTWEAGGGFKEGMGWEAGGSGARREGSEEAHGGLSGRGGSKE